MYKEQRRNQNLLPGGGGQAGAKGGQAICKNISNYIVQI